MRIVTWNCSMALHRKAAPLLALEPDIAVVCECAEPDRLRARGGMDWVQSRPVWVGQNPHKGLAVLARGVIPRQTRRTRRSTTTSHFTGTHSTSGSRRTRRFSSIRAIHTSASTSCRAHVTSALSSMGR